jgi:hypothetical protein
MRFEQSHPCLNVTIKVMNVTWPRFFSVFVAALMTITVGIHRSAMAIWCQQWKTFSSITIGVCQLSFRLVSYLPGTKIGYCGQT